MREGIGAVRYAGERAVRIEKAIAELAPQWSLALIVNAIQAMRGINFISAVTFMTEIGVADQHSLPRAVLIRSRVDCETSSCVKVIAAGLSASRSASSRQS